jgi:hypothetical protein
MGFSACNSEVIFNAGTALASQHRQLSGAVHIVYSPSSTSLHDLFLLVAVRSVEATKNPCTIQGLASSHWSPSSCGISAGIGTVSATSQMGCRVSTGRFPPPLWMRADRSATIHLQKSTIYLEASIPDKSPPVKKSGTVSQQPSVPL